MEEKLYGNVGKTLRRAAVLCGVIGLIIVGFGVLGLLTLFFDDDYLSQTIILLVSGLALYGSSLWMYGFAQIVDDVHAMRAKNDLKTYDEPIKVVDVSSNNIVNSKPIESKQEKTTLEQEETVFYAPLCDFVEDCEQPSTKDSMGDKISVVVGLTVFGVILLTFIIVIILQVSKALG